MKKKGILGMMLMGLASAGAVALSVKTSQDAIAEKDQKINKFKNYYNMLNEWLYLKQNETSLDTYFKKNDYNSIAIYGMGEMGNRLYDELKQSDIEVKYVIDKNATSVYSELEVLDPEEEFPEVDAIVVTATFAFDEIENSIENKVNCPIVSLEDVVYEV